MCTASEVDYFILYFLLSSVTVCCMTQIINFDRGRKIPHIKGMFYFLILSLANAEIVTIYIISLSIMQKDQVQYFILNMGLNLIEKLLICAYGPTC